MYSIQLTEGPRWSPFLPVLTAFPLISRSGIHLLTEVQLTSDFQSWIMSQPKPRVVAFDCGGVLLGSCGIFCHM
jgi:hypothetical protein